MWEADTKHETNARRRPRRKQRQGTEFELGRRLCCSVIMDAWMRVPAVGLSLKARSWKSPWRHSRIGKLAAVEPSPFLFRIISTCKERRTSRNHLDRCPKHTIGVRESAAATLGLKLHWAPFLRNFSLTLEININRHSASPGIWQLSGVEHVGVNHLSLCAGFLSLRNRALTETN
jgi:hypothetical protein